MNILKNVFTFVIRHPINVKKLKPYKRKNACLLKSIGENKENVVSCQCKNILISIKNPLMLLERDTKNYNDVCDVGWCHKSGMACFQ